MPISLFLKKRIKFNAFDVSNDAIFKLAYTLTLNDSLSVLCIADGSTSIESIALDARDRLEPTISEWIASGDIYPGKIPNVLSIDFANTTVTEQCIRISEFNLE